MTHRTLPLVSTPKHRTTQTGARMSTIRHALLWSLLAGVGMSTACGDPTLELDTALEVGTASTTMMQVLQVQTGADAGYYLVAIPFGMPISADYVQKMGHRFETLDELSTYLYGVPEIEILDIGVDAGQYQPLSLDEMELLALDHRGLFASYDDSALQLSAGGGWGRGKSSKGNCYRYAANDPMKPGQGPREHQESPGDTTGLGAMSPSDACEAMLEGAMADGATEPQTPDTGGEPECAEDEVEVCVVVAPDGSGGTADFHWYRDDGDGTWSHKPGYSAVSDRDASDEQITDPETADRDYGDINYSEFCGCLCIPNGSIDVDANDTTFGVIDAVKDVISTDESTISSDEIRLSTF